MKCPSFRHLEAWAPNLVFRREQLRHRANNSASHRPSDYANRVEQCRRNKLKDTGILQGVQLFRTFIRSHEGPNGETACEVAGMVVEDENSWLTLIQNASLPQ
jgi:hypothetical protein